MILRLFTFLFCLFLLPFTRALEGRTCGAYKARQFYKLLPTAVDLQGHCKYSSNLYHNLVDPDDSNLTDQCPSFLFDSIETTSPYFDEGDSVGEPGKKNETDLKKDAEQPPISTFEEWTKQKLEQEKQRKIQTANVINGAENGSKEHGTPQPVVGDKKTNSVTTNGDGHNVDEAPVSAPMLEIIPLGTNKRNYASKECGAKVLASNKESENKAAVLNDDGDEYLRNPCEYAHDKYLVLELCEAIQLTAVELADFEFFSSHVKEFRILASPVFPTTEWTNLGEFTAQNIRGAQTFLIADHSLHTKFVRLELVSHYGKEYYCTLSTLRVYGLSMIDEYEAEANSVEIQMDVASVEEVAVEENVTSSVAVDVDVPEVVEFTLPSIEAAVDVPVTQHPIVNAVPIHWRLGDCFKCTIGQQRSVTDWFCDVLFYHHHRQSRKRVSKTKIVVRSAGQVKFLKSIMNLLPMCPRGMTPPAENLNVKVKIDATKVEKPAVEVEVKPQPKVVKPKENPPPVPLPAGTTSSKESVFLKLNKRLAALELNISLSSQYLSELSKRYVAQVEENKHENEKNMKLADEKIARESLNLKKELSKQIFDLREEVSLLSKAVKSSTRSSSVLPTWTKETAGEFINSLAVRDCTRNDNCPTHEYDDVYLDESDGLWTTNQLLMILVAMQVSTIGVTCALFYFWRKSPVHTERVVLISSDYDVKQLLRDEIQKQLAKVEELPKIEPIVEIPVAILQPPRNTPPSKKKGNKRKKRNNHQLDLPDKWESTSVSSNFSSVSAHALDHDNASTTSEVSKKSSVTSADSCFASNGSENIPPSSNKLQ